MRARRGDPATTRTAAAVRRMPDHIDKDGEAEGNVMREHSHFEFVCANCARPIASESRAGVCPHCGVEYRIDWREDEVKAHEP